MNVTEGLLKSIGHFTAEEVVLFTEKAVSRNFKKNEILLNEGDVCKSAFYIVSGEAYQFSYDDIDENIIDLHMKDDWCLNHSSFVTQKPSTVTIKAYSELTVVELSLISVHELIALSPSFFQLGKVLEQTVSRVRYFDHANTAEEKHSQLFSSRPQLFQQFPLKMIASYLKIAPETLSRIRGKK
jgi:CRP-like cAMP-binding protein